MKLKINREKSKHILGVTSIGTGLGFATMVAGDLIGNAMNLAPNDYQGFVIGYSLFVGAVSMFTFNNLLKDIKENKKEKVLLKQI